MELCLQVTAAVSFVAIVIFSLATGAVLHFSQSKLEQKVRGRAAAAAILDRCARSEQLLLVASVASTFMDIVFVLSMALRYGQPSAGAFVALLAVASGILLVLGMMVPRQIARHNAEQVLLVTLPLLTLITRFLTPFQAFISPASRAISRLLNLREDHSIEEQVEDEILSAVHDGEREGVIREEEKEMIEGIIDLKDEDVADIMTPRTDMFSLPVDTPFDEAVAQLNEKGHSRVPVFDHNRDNILGILHVKDIPKYWNELAGGQRSLRQILRPPVFVPETKKIGELLKQFRHGRVHLAIVVDEYGGTAGIITIEDILEEIVGEIRDEFDTESAGEPAITMTARNCAVVDARVHMAELNEKLNLSLPENEGFDTVGGFVCSLAGHVPAQKERIDHEQVQFTVLSADNRRIHTLRVTRNA